MKRLLVLCCCFAIAVAGCSKEKSAATAIGVKEKSAAPAISVISMDNQQLTLASLKGKVVLLNFWATWCPPCREEIPSMIKLNSSMVGKPFKMVCVSVDEGGKKAVEDFFKNSGYYSLPAYVDPSGQAARSYGITGVPETFVIDRNGIVVKRVIGGLNWNSPEVISFIEGLMI
jgi:thiol-disulfide isomerase/thioredoxin